MITIIPPVIIENLAVVKANSQDYPGKLEFLELDEKRQIPRDASLDDAPCLLDS